MPSFAYKAINLSGQDVAGVHESSSRGDLVRELAATGLSVTSISEKVDEAFAMAGRSDGRRSAERPAQATGRADPANSRRRWRPAFPWSPPSR